MSKGSLMHNLGAFVGHIAKALRSDQGRTRVVKQSMQQEARGTMVLRRTTIEEIEIQPDRPNDPPSPTPEPETRNPEP